MRVTFILVIQNKKEKEENYLLRDTANIDLKNKKMFKENINTHVKLWRIYVLD